jgi:hypothetical protein
MQREATVLLPLLLDSLQVGSEGEEYQLLQKAEDREEKSACKQFINAGMLKSRLKKGPAAPAAARSNMVPSCPGCRRNLPITYRHR